MFKIWEAGEEKKDHPTGFCRSVRQVKALVSQKGRGVGRGASLHSGAMQKLGRASGRKSVQIPPPLPPGFGHVF